MRRFLQFCRYGHQSLSHATLILASALLFSRILGLLRDRLLTQHFSADELGVYFAAFRVPNMVFDLLVTGVLTSALIPVVTRILERKGKDEGFMFVSQLIVLSSCCVGFATVLLVILAPQLADWLAPGLSPGEREQMVSFTRFLLVFQVGPLVLGNVFTGTLHALQVFFLPALAPIVYNVGILLGIVFFSPVYGLWGPVLGVGIGALLFICIQLPALWGQGYRFIRPTRLLTADIRELGKLVGPRALGLGVAQIDATIDLLLASLLGTRMITIFSFAQNLQQLPVALFGATIAQALFPVLAKDAAKKDDQQYAQHIHLGLLQVAFWVLPVCMTLIVLRLPVTRLIYGSDRFDWEATVLTAATLSAFGISLLFQSAIHVLGRGFYALYDTKTPVAIAIVTIVLNSTLSSLFVLFFHFPIWALGISASIASSLQAVLLLLFLKRKMPHISLSQLVWQGSKVVMAAACMSLVMYGLLKLGDQLHFDTSRTINLLSLTLLVSTVGWGLYVFLCWVLGVDQVLTVLKVFKQIAPLRTKVHSLFVPSADVGIAEREL